MLLKQTQILSFSWVNKVHGSYGKWQVIEQRHLRQLNSSISHFCCELVIFGLTLFNFEAILAIFGLKVCLKTISTHLNCFQNLFFKMGINFSIKKNPEFCSRFSKERPGCQQGQKFFLVWQLKQPVVILFVNSKQQILFNEIQFQFELRLFQLSPGYFVVELGF